MVDSAEISQELIPLDRKRKNILLQAYPDIKHELDNNLEPDSKGSRGYAMGHVFEILTITEKTIGTETKRQRSVRKILEDMFANSNLVTGSRDQVKNPDFVSVIFDKNGNLVIKEVIEMKLSDYTLEKSKERNQPQKSIDTMEKIVSVVNQLISGIPISDIPHDIDISEKSYRKRINYLKRLRGKIRQLGIKDEISFSDELKYTYILPRDYETIEIPTFELTLRNTRQIKGEVTFSKFSRKNVEDIIDHYAETT